MEVEQQQAGPSSGWTWAAAPDPHQPKMSADTTAPHANPDAVTFQDVVDDPKAAFSKIGATLKRDLSDPKTWTMAAALYFGPKVVDAVLPIAREAAATGGAPASGGPSMLSRVGAAMKAGAPDLVKSIAGYRVGKAMDAIQKFGGALSAEPEAAPAVAPASPVASPSLGAPSSPSPGFRVLRDAHGNIAGLEPIGGATAVPAASPVASPPAAAAVPVSAVPSTAIQSPTVEAPPSAPSPQQVLNEAALARRRAEYQARQAAVPETPAPAAKPKLLAAEAPEYMRLIKAGKTHQQAMDVIQANRLLQERLGLSTPTAADTRFPKGFRGKVDPE